MKEKCLLSDEELLRNLGCGDEQAFEQIYNRYGPDLIDFAAKRLESLAEAKDVIQDIFVDIWSKREYLHINHSLKAYLFMAVRYKVIDHIRKNMQRSFYAKLIHSIEANSDDTTFDNILYRDLNNIMESEIEKLPCRAREVFLLSRKRNLSIKEIAGLMDISEQTVKNQLTTALKKLRFTLDKIIILLLLIIH